MNDYNISFSIPKIWVKRSTLFLSRHMPLLIVSVLSLVSVYYYIVFLQNGLGLSYNDARSHLDIGRRVVEGLKPGLAQLGSVWLPLPHLLMVLTIWNDFMWHSGLSGALESMLSFVATGLVIYFFLKRLKVGMLGRLTGVFMFAANLNILYMQSTAMTELLLIATSLLGVYELLRWQQENNIIYLILSSFWIMTATLNRYDGWFLLGYASLIVIIVAWRKFGIAAAEGLFFFFITLSGLGIVLWFLWNLLIFKDALYFIFGPYSAHAQQQQLSEAGVLATKKNLILSIEDYLYALAYNEYTLPVLFSAVGFIAFLRSKRYTFETKLVGTALLTPLVFNILALYLGFSVLFVQNISGNTWFNVRYGILMAPCVAIFIGYLVDSMKSLRYVLIGLLLFVTVFAFLNQDAVTIDDARVGSSQKNVSQVADWLAVHAAHTPGFVLIAAASHDAIIFSSGLPMSKFIHEGTGAYWTSATTSPDRWARWIIMRTNDMSDQTFRLIHNTPGFKKYNLIGHYPFADIYEIKPQYVSQLHMTPVFLHQK